MKLSADKAFECQLVPGVVVHRSAIPSTGRQRQEGQDFRVSLGYIESVSKPGLHKTLSKKSKTKPSMPNNNK